MLNSILPFTNLNMKKYDFLGSNDVFTPRKTENSKISYHHLHFVNEPERGTVLRISIKHTMPFFSP